MSIISSRVRKHCLVPCSKEKVKNGNCDCHNQISFDFNFDSKPVKFIIRMYKLEKIINNI